MKILDRVLLSVAALGVGIGCALACTHVDDVTRADADFAPSSVGYPYGTRFAGSFWQFDSSPDLASFPINQVIYTSGRWFHDNDTSFKVFTQFEVNDNGVVFKNGPYTWSITSLFSQYFFYLDSDSFVDADGYLFDEGLRLSLGEWLSVNCVCVEPPVDEIPDRGVSMPDTSTLLFFRMSEIANDVSVFPIRFFDMSRDDNVYVDFAIYNYLFPYSVTFHDTSNGFRVDNIRFLAINSQTDNFDRLHKPFLLFSNGNRVYEYGWLWSPAGTSTSNWVAGSQRFQNYWGPYQYWTAQSSSMVFGLAPADFYGYFSNEYGDNHQYLERIRVYINAFLGYSQFVYADNDTDFNDRAYQNGYENGYRAGNGDGYQSGYSVGWEEGRRVGYNQGQASVTDETTAVMNLFGAVISVPIGVLNGLSPLAIWNTPIIAIIVTFLFMGVLFMILKKVL